MRKPFEGGYSVTQTFGNDLIINGVHLYAQWGYKGHNGIDYGVPTGVTVLAPHRGTIKEAYFDATGYGWYVKIENDVEGSVLGHMLSLAVKVNDIVSEGQQVGISDNTGNSTGSHIHWGYYRFPRDKNNGYGGYIDQAPYLAVTNTNPATGNSITDFLISKGYIDTNVHLDVIKALYDSDMKLKSGTYISQAECDKIVIEKQQVLKDTFNKEKETWQIQKDADIKTAVELARVEVESKYQDYLQVKNSSEYKFALFIFKSLHLNKKGGE